MSAFEPIGHDSVIQLTSEPIAGKTTFTGGELVTAIATKEMVPDSWVKDGVSCRCLLPSGEWMKGSVRVSLEFQQYEGPRSFAGKKAEDFIRQEQEERKKSNFWNTP